MSRVSRLVVAVLVDLAYISEHVLKCMIFTLSVHLALSVFITPHVGPYTLPRTLCVSSQFLTLSG